MARRCAVLALLLASVLPASARERLWGYCERGGAAVKTSGTQSTTKVQQSFPSCTVTVYLTGTLSLATLFSDDDDTPKSNPFTASNTGYFFAYADNGRYDVQMSGTDQGVPFSFTTADILLNDTPGGGGGGGVGISVNGGAIPGSSANFNDTTPAAPANALNVNFAKDSNIATNISASVPYASGGVPGVMALANDLGGTALAPIVLNAHPLAPWPISIGGTGAATAPLAFAALAPSPGAQGSLLVSTGASSWGIVPLAAPGLCLISGATTWSGQTCVSSVSGQDITPKSVNGFVYATQFPGGDIGAKINNAQASLGSAGGTIIVPNGTYAQTTQVAVVNPAIRIQGGGSGGTILTYTGSGCAFDVTSNPFTVLVYGPVFTGFTIAGTGNVNANTCGVHFYDVIGLITRDFLIKDFTNTGSSCLWEDVKVNWTERSDIKASLYNCKSGFKLTNSRSPQVATTYGYGSFDLKMNCNTGQTCVDSDGGVGSPTGAIKMGDSYLKFIMNMDNAGTCISLKNNSQWRDGLIFDVRCEQTSGSGATGFSVDATSAFRGLGVYNDTGGLINTLAGNVSTSSRLTNPCFSEQLPLSFNCYFVTPINPAASRNLSIVDPGGNDTFVFASATQTLSGKTLAGPIVNGIFDASAATEFRIQQTGQADPNSPLINCSANPMDMILARGSSNGQNMWFCTSNNVWTQQLNSGAAGANQQLSNLSGTTAVGVNLLPSTAGTKNLGSTTVPWASLFFGSGSGNTGTFTGTFTGNRVFTFPDSNINVAGVDFAQTWTATQTFASTLANSLTSRTANAASGAFINMANGEIIRARNGSNTGNVDALAVDANNFVLLGGASGSSGVKMTGTLTTAAAGGPLTLVPQAATGNNNGANLNLQGGNGAGTGTNGDVFVQPGFGGSANVSGLFVVSGPQAFPLTNSPTGTQISKLVSYDSSGRGIVTPAGATQGLAGVCQENCATTGSAFLVKIGTTQLNLDNTGVPGDYVCISSTTAGFGHDCATTPTTQTIGVVRSAVSGTIYNVDVLITSPSSGGSINAIVTNPGATQTIKSTLNTAVSLQVDCPNGAAGSLACLMVRDNTGASIAEWHQDHSFQVGSGTGGSITASHYISPVTPAATTSVLEGGDTDCLVGWRNHANNADINICKDTQDIINIGGTLSVANLVTSGNLLKLTEAGTQAGASGFDVIYAQNVYHQVMVKLNGGSERALRLVPLVRTVTGTGPDAIGAADNGSFIVYTNGGATGATLPQAAGSSLQNFCVTVVAQGAGTVTITPTTSTINGGATFAVATGKSAEVCADGSTAPGNYLAVMRISTAGAGDMILNATNTMGASGIINGAAMVADGGLIVPTAAGATCPTAGSWCYNSTTGFMGYGNGTGTTFVGQKNPRNFTSTSDTIVTTDRERVVAYSNASAISVSLPQANGTTFPNGWSTCMANRGAGAVTITPVTSTIDGQSSVTLNQFQSICVASNGATYFSFNRGLQSGLGDPGGNGIVARTALNTTINRTITGTTNHITATNGDGVSGDPTLDIGADVVTQTANGTTGNVPKYNANSRVLTDSGIAITALVQTSRALTGGAGIAAIGDLSADRTIATASGEADFLASGALTCGAATQGKMQVHTTPLQYCDNAATPTLQYAAYGDSSGNAKTGDSATAFFTAGQIEAARGGTGIDSSGSTGEAYISAGTWIAKVKEMHIIITGSGSGGVMQNTDDQPTVWVNHAGRSMTVTKVYCETDSGTALTMQMQKDDGSPTNMLSSDLSCSSTEANTTTFVSGENVLADTDRLDYLTVSAGGGAHWVAVHLTVTY